jgi:hypothetical protein
LGACGADGDRGGPSLAWDGTPVVRSSPTGAHVLIGKVENTSSGELRLKAPQVRVVTHDDRTLTSSATFVSAYVRSNYPHNRGALSRPSGYPAAEQERVGYVAVLDAGERTPLTVSWREPRRRRTAERIVVGGVTLRIPAAAH